MKLKILGFILIVTCALQIGCGEDKGEGGGGARSSGPQPEANHPLAKMSTQNVVEIHAQLAKAEQSVRADLWPTLSGHRLYTITQTELQLSQELIVTDLDRRMFLRFYDLMIDQSCHVRPQILPREILNELKYEFYRGTL